MLNVDAKPRDVLGGLAQADVDTKRREPPSLREVAASLNVHGNSACWDINHYPSRCCDLGFGPTGNPACWSGDYNYFTCCPQINAKTIFDWKNGLACCLLGIVVVRVFVGRFAWLLREAGRKYDSSIKSKDFTPSQMPQSQLFADSVAKTMNFSTWFDIIPQVDSPFLHEIGPHARLSLSFSQLHRFARCDDACLRRFGISVSDRVCTLLPNGPEAAASFLVLAVQCALAPLNVALSEGELAFEFEDLPCHTLILMQDLDRVDVLVKLAASHKVQVLEMVPNLRIAGLFALSLHKDTSCVHPECTDQDGCSKRSDIALVLHTSGTTKKPKLVPLTHENLISAALCINSTLQLRSSHKCLNMMPLFHLHGLSVNILATSFSGASVICSAGFRNASESLNSLNDVTWYSAVPTMHQSILELAEARQREGKGMPNQLELIRNCSAALPPVIAERMMSCYNCIVLPTYAATESCPIASNPRMKLRFLSSVGLAAGPDVRICDDCGRDEPPGIEGEICVRGACVTKGYEYRPAHMDQDPNIEAFHQDAWFRTGDKAFLGQRGYIVITGRFKEIINRAGEKIAPLQVEHLCKRHPGLLDCMAFAMPHCQLGEVVGLALVPRPGYETDLSLEMLADIRRFLESSKELSPKWLPEALILVGQIPKGPTGKPARIGLAKSLQLAPLDSAYPDQHVLWDATSGSAVALSSSRPKAVQTIDVVDSLGITRQAVASNNVELRIIHTMYGLSTMVAVARHIINSDTAFRDMPKLLAFIKDGNYQLVHGHWMALFVVCIGYQEASRDRFRLGLWDLLLCFMLVLFKLLPTTCAVVMSLVFQINYDTMYRKLEKCVAQPECPYVLRGHEWFLYSLFAARLLLLCLRQLRLPSWIQVALIEILGAVCTQRGYISLDHHKLWRPPVFLRFASLYLSSAHYGPTMVLRSRTWYRHQGFTAQVAIRALSLLVILASAVTYCFIIECMHEAESPWLTAEYVLNMPLTFFWVGALTVVIQPGIPLMELLGRYSLGAYMTHQVLKTFIAREEGITLDGITILPPLQMFAERLGEPPSAPVAFVLIALVYVFVLAFVGGACFQWFLSMLIDMFQQTHLLYQRRWKKGAKQL